MKLALLLSSLAGLALATALVAYTGLDAIGDAFLAAGWPGLVAISLFHLVPLALCALAWRCLAPGLPGLPAFLWFRWLRDGANDLLAILPAAGEIAAVRVMTLGAVPPGLAAAATVVDLTMELASQLVFTVIGLVLLCLTQPDTATIRWAALGVAVSVPAVAGFILAQHLGLFRMLEGMARKLAAGWDWLRLPETDSIHAAIKALYRNPARLAAAFATHLLAWLVGVGEAWLALQLMGVTLDLATVTIIESLIFALRSIAFLVPGALGVQEGGYVVLGAVLGLPPEFAIALSFLKRGREILLGVPALVAWQCLEGGQFWSRARGRV
jgi:putative membrane protein